MRSLLDGIRFRMSCSSAIHIPTLQPLISAQHLFSTLYLPHPFTSRTQLFNWRSGVPHMSLLELSAETSLVPVSRYLSHSILILHFCLTSQRNISAVTQSALPRLHGRTTLTTSSSVQKISSSPHGAHMNATHAVPATRYVSIRSKYLGLFSRTGAQHGFYWRLNVVNYVFSLGTARCVW